MDRDDVAVAVQAVVDALVAHGSVSLGPGAQPLVEDLAVDHADEALAHRDVHRAAGRRADPGGVDAIDEEGLRHVEVPEELRRNGATAGLHATRAIEEGHLCTGGGEIGRGRRAGRTSADDDRIEDGSGAHGAEEPDGVGRSEAIEQATRILLGLRQ